MLFTKLKLPVPYSACNGKGKNPSTKDEVSLASWPSIICVIIHPSCKNCLGLSCTGSCIYLEDHGADKHDTLPR